MRWLRCFPGQLQARVEGRAGHQVIVKELQARAEGESRPPGHRQGLKCLVDDYRKLVRVTASPSLLAARSTSSSARLKWPSVILSCLKPIRRRTEADATYTHGLTHASAVSCFNSLASVHVCISQHVAAQLRQAPTSRQTGTPEQRRGRGCYLHSARMTWSSPQHVQSDLGRAPGLGSGEVGRCLLPVDDIPEGLDVLRAAVLRETDRSAWKTRDARGEVYGRGETRERGCMGG